MPRDARELVILQRLTEIRDKLLLLKQDRTTYIRSQDIIPLYDQTIAQVKELNAIRKENPTTDENRGKTNHPARHPTARDLTMRAHTNLAVSVVDKVLEGCFQLLSLFYLTIGRNNEAPATYALTSTIKRLLDHLIESNLYSAKDLESVKTTLETLSTNISHSGDETAPGPQHSPYLLELLSKRVERCNTTIDKLLKRLESLSESSMSTYEKMISILRSISYANTRSKVGNCDVLHVDIADQAQFSTSEVQKLQKQLHEIGEKNNGGKFCADGEESPGAATMQEVYKKCSVWSEMVLER